MFLAIQTARVANTFGCINKIYKAMITIILGSNCFSLANFYEIFSQMIEYNVIHQELFKAYN